MTVKIHFKHYHEGNEWRDYDKDFDDAVDSGLYNGSGVSDGPICYATRARAVEEETGIVLAVEWAFCSVNDCPTRAKGRAISEGRLRKVLKLNEDKAQTC